MTINHFWYLSLRHVLDFRDHSWPLFCEQKKRDIPFSQKTYFEQERTLEHTIRKRQEMAGQNTFQILLLNDANMIGEH